MNRAQAYDLVQQTFKHAFDKNRFSDFSRNLLNHVDESKAASWNSQYVKDAFKDHVQRYERLGTYTSPEKEKLDVLIVHLTNESKLERARTAIRNFVADHLKTRDEKDAALVAFVSPSENTWRFSYVKMEYATVEKDSGKVGVETRLTPARRFSYIVGEGESCHTAQTRFFGLLQDTEADPTLADIEEAFSVEAVTKEFFTKYVELFGEIHKALEKLVAKDKTLRDEFTAKGVNTVEFAKKLMGQIVFLYFLQKKGWLGVATGQDWGRGPRDFLRRLANGEYGKYGNFFNDVLEPLFYNTLATDRGHEAWCNRFNCRIPFLNGGLFEPPGDYDWRKTDIILPDKLFTNSEFVEEGITGSGVLDVFDRYNFTVNEAEPLEKEVAIDPEMLGKVFENLIEDNRRKGLGAYYTPREIVHYMCQESLINYLDAALNTRQQSLVPTKPKQANLFGETEPQQTTLQTAAYEEIVPRSDVETFVHLGEQISHYEAVETEYRIKMPKSIEPHARLIDKKLSEITICDPAVGSGAFPVGMMTEIVRARSALTPYFNDVHERTRYHFKRHAIQNCLYGVDIDPGAVEIAKLRLWLSLVVDEEDVKQIKPLPNLDYKVVAGNSLLGVEKNLFNVDLFNQLEKLKPLYFDETDKTKKDKYRREIDELIHQLTNGKQTFDFQIYFSEVIHKKDGFDVCIGNPPYITYRGKERVNVSDEYVKRLIGLFPNSAEYKVNSYALFIEQSTRHLAPLGVLAFIVPSTILQNEYLQKIRRHLLSHYHIAKIISFGNKVFQAVTDSIILFVENKWSTLCVTKVIRQENLVFDNSAESRTFPQSAWLSPKGCIINIKIPTDQLDLLLKIEDGSVLLEELLEVYVGIVASGIKGFLSTTRLNNQFKKYLQGRHMRRYIYVPAELYINFDVSRLHSNTDERVYLQPEKLLVRKTGNTLLASYDDKQFYTDQSIYNLYKKRGCKVDLKFILALLNSHLMNYYFRSKMVTNPDVFPYIKGIHLKLLPIRTTSNEVQTIIANIVDRILTAKKRDPKADTMALEREIDRLVYKLYDLTPEEIAIVEAVS